MLRSLRAFADRSVPRGTPVSYLPGAGALVIPEGTTLTGLGTDTISVFPNEWRAAQIGRTVDSAFFEKLKRFANFFRGAKPRAADTAHLDEMGVPNYRRQTNSSGRNVVVGVLDTGIAKHPDFDDRIRDFVTVDPSGVVARAQPADPQGHGTHVSGLIAGKHTGVAPDEEVDFEVIQGANGPMALNVARTRTVVRNG